MLTVDQKTLDQLDELYPGLKSQLHRFENAALPACANCDAADTASVQVGLIGRTMNLTGATTKFKLIANGPKPGKYFCNQCKEFFS